MDPGRPLRVHTLIDSLGWGGAEMLLAELAEGVEAASMRLSVGYLFEKDGSPAAARLRARGVDPVLVPVTGLVKPSAFRDVRRHLAAADADVLHTHLGYADLLGGAAARTLGVPAVSTIHVTEWETDVRNRTKLRLMALARRRCAARVISVSEGARRSFLSAGWDSADRVVTVHNGIAARPRPGAGTAVRAQLGLRPDDVVAGMVSVLRPGKGHDVAVEAVAALREEHPALRLLIVGDGPERVEVERLAARLGDGAVLAGHRDDVMEVFDAIDVLVHPSQFDAFPTALLEAMACGIPVVATAIGGIPEIVEPEGTGLLLEAHPRADELAAKLGRLLADPGERRRMGQRASLRFAEEFTVARWAERLRVVYDDARRVA